MDNQSFFDIFSFIMGLLKGCGNVILDSDTYVFTDANNDGNIVIQEAE